MRRILILGVLLCLCGLAGAQTVTMYKGSAETSLAAVTSTGAASAYLVVTKDSSGNYPTNWTWTNVFTGSPASTNTNLEGSIDAVTWFTLDSSTTTTSEMRHVAYKSVKFVRCNLSTLSGGTAPTATCKIASF